MIKFLVTDEYNVKDPVADYRDNGYNAGIDGFIPSNTPEFVKAFKEKNPELDIEEDGTIRIPPHGDACIPSGLYSQLEPNTMLLDLNKSGIATKKKLAVGACVIDVSYQGIIHYHVFNFSNEWRVLKCDEKVCQMVQVPILTGMEVVHGKKPEEFFTEKTDRATGGFGSTGLK